jgi:hypothetical protein
MRRELGGLGLWPSTQGSRRRGNVTTGEDVAVVGVEFTREPHRLRSASTPAEDRLDRGTKQFRNGLHRCRRKRLHADDVTNNEQTHNLRSQQLGAKVGVGAAEDRSRDGNDGLFDVRAERRDASGIGHGGSDHGRDGLVLSREHSLQEEAGNALAQWAVPVFSENGPELFWRDRDIDRGGKEVRLGLEEVVDESHVNPGRRRDRSRRGLVEPVLGEEMTGRHEDGLARLADSTGSAASSLPRLCHLHAHKADPQGRSVGKKGRAAGARGPS